MMIKVTDDRLKFLRRNAAAGRCIILFMRHGWHGKDGCPKNVLTPEAKRDAEETGNVIAGAGITIKAAWASPQNRCHSTVEHCLIGAQQMIPIRTNDRLGDFSLQGIDSDAIKAAAKTAKVDSELFVLNYEPMKTALQDNGYEGGICLQEIASRNAGQFVLVGSHGGTRMEVTIHFLKTNGIFEPSAIKAEDIIPRGKIIALVIEPQNGRLYTTFKLWD